MQLKGLLDFLMGRSAELEAETERKMWDASGAEQFELASFLRDQLLAIREVNTGLRNACKTAMRLLRNLGDKNLMTAMHNLKSCREVLDNAVKQGIPAISDKCPKCGAGCDERELLKKDFLDIEAVQMHYKCNKCGSEIIEEFTLTDVFIDSPDSK